MITIRPLDHTWSYVDGPEDATQLARDYFVFESKNSKWSPGVKNGHWDGKFRLVNFKGMFYSGLAERFNNFFIKHGYESEVEYLVPKENHDIKKFIANLELSKVPYDFQFDSLQYALNNHRATFLSPTATGKSLMIYGIARFHEAQQRKTLIMVPTTHLVEQMTTDFIEYNTKFDPNKIQKIYQGHSKNITKPITVSTWQSLDDFTPKFFNQFDCIMVDEAHGITAKTMKGILEKATEVPFRFGFTGTLDNEQCHKLVIEGLTGPIQQTTTIMKAVDNGILSNLLVKCVVLKWKDKPAFKSYQEEMAWLYTSKQRNTLLAQLCKNSKKNTILLCNSISQINAIKDQIKSINGKDPLIVIGEIPPHEREQIRKYAEKNDGTTILATYGCYSVGVNICNVQRIIFGSPSKSQIRVLQSIGRGLRKDGKENYLEIIDLIDDFGTANYIKSNFLERIKIYIKEQIPYKQQVINI